MIEQESNPEVTSEAKKIDAILGRTSTYLYVLSLYFVTVGVLYLWGYWSVFDVNILEYLSLADVIKATAFPIASTFGLVVLGVVFGEILAGEKTVTQRVGIRSKAARVIRTYPRQVIGFYILLCLALLMFGSVEKWVVLPFLVALPVVIAGRRSSLISKLVGSERTGSYILMLAAILPTLAFGIGRIRANEILDGDRFKYVVSSIDQIQARSESQPTTCLRFLGHAGDVLFFIDPIEVQLVISKMDTGTALLLKHYKKPRRNLFGDEVKSEVSQSLTVQQPSSTAKEK